MVSNIPASVLYPQTLYKDLQHEEKKLLTQKLSVLEPLVDYGLYEKDEEIKEIIKFLINILEGSCKEVKAREIESSNEKE